MQAGSEPLVSCTLVKRFYYWDNSYLYFQFDRAYQVQNPTSVLLDNLRIESWFISNNDNTLSTFNFHSVWCPCISLCIRIFNGYTMSLKWFVTTAAKQRMCIYIYIYKKSSSWCLFVCLDDKGEREREWCNCEFQSKSSSFWHDLNRLNKMEVIYFISYNASILKGGIGHLPALV